MTAVGRTIRPGANGAWETARKILVQCTGVARTYGTGPAAVVAVHGAHCLVRRGDRIALTGPSGSGKSTLLHLMAGLETPTSGHVVWPAWAKSPVGRPGTAALVFQGPTLLPTLDVGENVALPLVLSGVSQPAAQRQAEAALATLGIDSLVGKLPDELSGGQAQRVAVARALVVRPALILADEPTGQLDRAGADRVVAVLVKAADKLDAGLVVATHDEGVAARLDRRWQMTDGRLHTDTDVAVGAARPR